MPARNSGYASGQGSAGVGHRELLLDQDAQFVGPIVPRIVERDTAAPVADCSSTAAFASSSKRKCA